MDEITEPQKTENKEMDIGGGCDKGKGEMNG